MYILYDDDPRIALSYDAYVYYVSCEQSGSGLMKFTIQYNTIYKLKVLDQPVTSEVRSSAEKSRKPVIADNFASDGARAKFQRPACCSR